MRTAIICLTTVFCFPGRPAFCGLIERIVVFPTADSLRIHAWLGSAEDLPHVEIGARLRPVNGGPLLREASLGTVDLPAGKPTIVERTIEELKGRPWSPGSPALYELTLSASRNGALLDSETVRTGFRSVESRDGQILLNGQPIFLRGLAINPPGRGVPDTTAFTPAFAYDYVRYLRSRNFNCIRLNLDFTADPRAQIWFDACDELGMLVYQGCYGSPPSGLPGDRQGKEHPPQDLEASVAAYQGVFETYARHPSIIIYILSNELPYTGARGRAWHEFLTAVHGRLKAWDPTRLCIGNAGYGEGKEGDINDVHRYWGWYYNSFLTYYNLRRAQDIFGHKDAVQPFTFSECVGSFTSSLGEVNLIFRKQLGAQLHWTGHSPTQAEDALAYQAFMAQRACESFRTMRETTPRLAGLMPFTIPFHHWDGITRFDQMQPKPVADAMSTAYQPVLLAWELWTPQVYAGATIRPRVHVVNDAEDFSVLHDARLGFRLADGGGKVVLAGQQSLPVVPYFGHTAVPLPLTIPQDTPTGDYWLTGSILVNGKTISLNQTTLFVAGRSWRTSLSRPAGPQTPLLYDPSGATAKALAALSVGVQRVTELTKLPPGGRLIVGEDTLTDEDLGRVVRGGGRVLLLGQDVRRFQPGWLPARIEMLAGSANEPVYLGRKRPTADQMNINIERPDHPVFTGLDRSRFHLWSDYTQWDQTKPGFPAVYPVTRGFRLTRAEDLSRTAILANYDRGLEGIAICEMFDGRGSVIATGMDLVNRAGSDPVADRVLANLVAYLSAERHPLHPLVDKPIQWGRYATEKGLITGPLNGLVVNCRWVCPPTDPTAKPLPDNQGAWNMLPGDQFVAFGRRAIGPYTYNNGTATVELDKAAKDGSGFFHAALPPGRRAMVTQIQNPSKADCRIEITVNQRKQTFSIPAGQTGSVRNELADEPLEVKVSYMGDKRLILLETRFE